MDCIVTRHGIPGQINKAIVQLHHENSMNKRFSRHALIPDWNQGRLSDASVVVIGMGALGNEVSRILAMSGVGKMILCDPDIIEESNLSRTLLFKNRDMGRLKVEAAAEKLKELYPEIVVIQRPLPLVHGVGLAELRDASLTLGCLDSRSARLQLAGRCQLVQAGYIDGGTHPWGGEVRPYLDSEGPCYGCSLTAKERAIVDIPWTCLDEQQETPSPSAIPSSALVGTWMAMIAVRYLMGLPCPSEILKIDGVRGTTVVINQSRDLECPLHMPAGKAAMVAVRHTDTLQDLRKVIPEKSTPLAWSPVQQRLECLRCKYVEIKWGIPKTEKCPQCDHPLHPRTTLELEETPGTLKLEELGIPPRELLAIRTKNGLQWVELED